MSHSIRHHFASFLSHFHHFEWLREEQHEQLTVEKTFKDRITIPHYANTILNGVGEIYMKTFLTRIVPNSYLMNTWSIKIMQFTQKLQNPIFTKAHVTQTSYHVWRWFKSWLNKKMYQIDGPWMPMINLSLITSQNSFMKNIVSRFWIFIWTQLGQTMLTLDTI